MINISKSLAVFSTVLFFCTTGFASAPVCPSAAEIKQATYSGPESFPEWDAASVYLTPDQSFVFVSGNNQAESDALLQKATASYTPVAKSSSFEGIMFYYCTYLPGNNNPLQNGVHNNISWVQHWNL